MHKAQQLLTQLCSGDISLAPNLTLTSTTSMNLFTELTTDARSYYYSAALSLLEAVIGLEAGRYSWAMVKLYYSSFYSIRSLLAINGTVIFYIGKKPRLIDCRQGESPRSATGKTSHEVVFKAFATKYPNSNLLTHVGGVESFDWLKIKREEASYKWAKFIEPVVPRHFDYVSSVGLEKAIQAYLMDAGLLITFLQDHAALSLPLLCLRRARIGLQAAGLNLEHVDAEYISTSFESLGSVLNVKAEVC
jgi:hypothetical protein